MRRDTNEGVDVRTFAESARALLTADPLVYRNWGVYWYFVKAVLRKLYDRHAMPMLGDYIDAAVVQRMPDGLGAHDMLRLAVEEFAHNAAFNLGRGEVTDPAGERFLLVDPDIES